MNTAIENGQIENGQIEMVLCNLCGSIVEKDKLFSHTMSISCLSNRLEEVEPWEYTLLDLVEAYSCVSYVDLEDFHDEDEDNKHSMIIDRIRQELSFIEDEDEREACIEKLVNHGRISHMDMLIDQHRIMPEEVQKEVEIDEFDLYLNEEAYEEEAQEIDEFDIEINEEEAQDECGYIEVDVFSNEPKDPEPLHLDVCRFIHLVLILINDDHIISMLLKCFHNVSGCNVGLLHLSDNILYDSCLQIAP